MIFNRFALVAVLLPTIVLSKPKKEKEEKEIRKRIRQCKKSAETAGEIAKYREIQFLNDAAGSWAFPANLRLPGSVNGDLPTFEAFFGSDLPLPFGYTETYGWFSNRVPSKYDPANPQNFPGLPPDFDPNDPVNSFQNMLQTGFVHETEGVPTWGHPKFPVRIILRV